MLHSTHISRLHQPGPRPGAAQPSSRVQPLSVITLTAQRHGKPAPRLVLAPAQQIDRSCRIVVRGAKDGLDAELEATQKTLDKVLQAVQAAQAAQAAQQQPEIASSGGLMQEAALISREQQLWDRQQALMDRMQQQWDQERQAFLSREQQLLSELGQLRQELNQLLLNRAAAAAAAAPPPPAPPPAAAAAGGASPPSSSIASSPAAAAAAAAALSAASRPGTSAMPGQGTISGPSSASAAVAAAIRAVRDEGLTRPPTASSDAADSPGGSWEDLFASSGDRAVSSVAAALSAANTTDVLADMDLSFSSSSSSSSSGRGRRRLDGSNGSSSSSNGASSSGSSVTSSSSVTATESLEDAPAAANSPSPSPSSSSSSSGGGSNSGVAVEVQKGDPQGPPPVLTAGNDDIYWVSKLHDALMAAGFYPSDDEVENWLFAESTQSALLTFQACNSLPETGVTCEATWRQLLGEEAYEAAYGHLSSGSSSSSSSSSSGSSSCSSAPSAVEAVEAANGEVTFSFSSSSSSNGSNVSATVTASDDSGSSSSSGSGVSGSVRVSSSGWPVVMDMDGGKEVHALQVCLQRVGYFCGDDDMRWWQFGSATLDALKTFQACNGLPESGVCDERTWLALLGPDATPEDLDEVHGDESMYEDDMSAPHEGAVWLVGEQRWSKPTPSN